MKFLTIINALIIWLVLSSVASACTVEEVSIEDVLEKFNTQLSGPYEVRELEISHMIEIRSTGEIKPFGYANGKWLEFKSKKRVGDQILFFTQSGVSEGSEYGWYVDGYMLVREGCIIDIMPGKST